MAPNEEAVLRHLLSMYPVVPDDHHPLTREGDETEYAEDREMLRELASETRAANLRRVHGFFYNEHIHRTDEEVVITLSPDDSSWLLEMLNDVRVGSWLKLGSPDAGSEEALELTAESAQQMWAMEAAGVFQSVLLNTLMNGE